MHIAFARHNCSSTTEVLQMLWDQRLVALHYEDIDSLNPDDYPPAGNKALKRMQKYCRDGALIGADYRRLTNSEMLIGYIPAGSTIVANTFVDSATGKTFIYKTVKLLDAVVVRYRDYPVLGGIQPRQATLTGWPSAQRVLEAILAGTSLEREHSSLHPSQLEVLCYEWLRTKGFLERLILPIGRGLVDIDIVGVSQTGKRVVAQVTNGRSISGIEDKKRRLLSHANDRDDIYFFSPACVIEDSMSQIRPISLESVLSDLQSCTDQATRTMIEQMFEPSQLTNRCS